MQPLHESATDDRFDILDEGVFLEPRKGETFTVSVIIAAGILALAAAFMLLRWFVLTGNDSETALNRGDELIHAFFDMSVSFTFWGVFIISAVVIFVIAAVCVRLVAKGNAVPYSAGAEVFSFEYGGAQHAYRYGDVSGVFFEPMTIMGRTRGYSVTICAAGRTQEVKVLFARGGERTPDMTPFWLLHIRSAQIRAARAQAAPPEPKRAKYWRS